MNHSLALWLQKKAWSVWIQLNRGLPETRKSACFCSQVGVPFCVWLLKGHWWSALWAAGATEVVSWSSRESKSWEMKGRIEIVGVSLGNRTWYFQGYFLVSASFSPSCLTLGDTLILIRGSEIAFNFNSIPNSVCAVLCVCARVCVHVFINSCPLKGQKDKECGTWIFSLLTKEISCHSMLNENKFSDHKRKFT